MDKQQAKQHKYLRRKARSRAHVFGTPERPRLMLHRTLKHLEAQIIDDTAGKTLIGMSDIKAKATGAATERATAFGDAFAKAALKQDIKTVVFDRNGRAYHGRVKAFVEAVRNAGIQI